jgi:alcohol dehydrogenase
MLPDYYEFYNPVRIVSGKKALESIPGILLESGARRPLILTDAAIVKAKLMLKVSSALRAGKINPDIIFKDIHQDSSLDTVKAARDMYIENRCDSLIAVGGGSVIDTAKAANIMISENTGDLRKFEGLDRLKTPQVPLIVVPTTVGTGSEATGAAVIYDPDRKAKIQFISPLIFPKAAVLDPRMTETIPPKLLASTAMDALSHAVEAYSCLQKNPMSDAYAFTAVNLIRQNLVKALENEGEREEVFALANAALLAGLAFSNSMVGAVHALGHACGAVAHVPHGIAMGLLLPAVMEFNIRRAEEYYADLLLPLAGEEVYAQTPVNVRATRAIHEIRKLQRDLHDLCGFPLTLKDAGVTASQVREIAKASVNEAALITNPRDMTAADAEKILMKVL